MHHTMKSAPALLLAASFTAAQIPCGGMAKPKPKLSTKRLSIVFLIILLTIFVVLSPFL